MRGHAHADELRDADGVPLRLSLRRSLRRQRLRALGLVLPLAAFVLLAFVWPIGSMLLRSVDNDIVADTLPRTVRALADWRADSARPPGDAAYAALLADLRVAVRAKAHTRLGTRLNYERSGLASLFRKTGRRVARLQPGAVAPPREILVGMDRRWADPAVWAAIKVHSGRLTDGYFLNALDLRRTAAGVERQPEDRRILLQLFWRTLLMSFVITAACLLLGYPVAWLLASLPPARAGLLMIFVLLPFWTSLLVRTSAWKVLLQQQGVVNDILVWLGLVADDARLVMINNQIGTLVAMTHILLPFMILPLYAVMKTIPASYVDAAKSLGATDWTAFWRVYFPQSAPGIGAGAILVFILAIGYYITPEIVGGTEGVFISNRIAYHISSSLNWGLAAALATVLLAVVLVLYWLYERFVGMDSMKLG